MLLMFTFTLELGLVRHVLASAKLSYPSLALVKCALGLTKLFVSATLLPISN